MKMTLQNAIKSVSARYQYQRESGLGDRWRIMKARKNGMLHGDCEDFALTALYRHLGLLGFILQVLILHRGRIWYVKTAQGGGHAVGEYKGLWFDNWTHRTMSKDLFFAETGHRRRFPYPAPWIVFNLLTGKIGFAPAALITLLLSVAPVWLL